MNQCGINLYCQNIIFLPLKRDIIKIPNANFTLMNIIKNIIVSKLRLENLTKVIMFLLKLWCGPAWWVLMLVNW